MQGFSGILVEQLKAWSALEVIAVVLAIAYLVLAIRQNIWCWLCALISTAIYVYLFAEARLYMESVLNAFYSGMAVYGWSVWRGGSAREQPAVTRWPANAHAAAVAIIAALSAVNGFVLDRFTDAAFPYIDSMTTWAALWATFLIARKVLENWWYWLAIDLVSVVIYWNRDLQLTALLFAVYVVMIPFGLWSWSSSYRRHSQAVPA